VVWCGLDRDKGTVCELVNKLMNLRIPQNAVKFLNGYTTGGISSSAQLHRVSWLCYHLLRYSTMQSVRES
jgi:hypothetical protein